MQEFRIDTFDKLHAWVNRHDQKFTIYRGMRDVAYALTPKIGRRDITLLGPLEHVEQKFLTQFQDRAVPHLTYIPRNDWEWLALMQHHGVPTRLLDWTRNPLVAAYFAVEDKSETDSVVYAWLSKARTVAATTKSSPFNVRGVQKFIPAHLSPRIIAQSGLFTIHSSPTQPMESSDLERAVIVNAYRKPLKDTLFKFGINRAFIYPGLDGIADLLSWMFTESH